jgi:hypothetical protein
MSLTVSKRLVVTIFAFSYMIGLLQPVLPLLEYAAFKTTWTELFCINKDVPESTCEAGCYLGKKIEENQDDARQSGVSLIQLESYPIGLISLCTVSLQCLIGEDHSYANLQVHLRKGYPNALERPPSVA